MKKILFTLLTIFAISYSPLAISCTHASPQPKEIIAEATYQAGDSDTPVAAQEAALLLAKRNALEQCGTLVTSSTTIQNYIVKDDTVRSLAAGVMEVTILDKKRTPVGNGTEFYVKIRAIVYPNKLENALKILQNGGTVTAIKPLPTRRIFTSDPESGNASMNHLLLKGIQNNDIDMIKTAIANGANINIYEGPNQATTALMMSIGNDEIMEYLISLGADVNAPVSTPGWAGGQKTPVIEAILTKNLHSVQILTENGANLNFSDNRGWRPLDQAITNESSIQIVKYLIMNGATVNYTIKSLGQTTPLMLAIKKGNIQLIQLLINAGANTKALDLENQTALDYAIKTGNKEIINLFIN